MAWLFHNYGPGLVGTLKFFRQPRRAIDAVLLIFQWRMLVPDCEFCSKIKGWPP